jgi:hypothetical protein
LEKLFLQPNFNHTILFWWLFFNMFKDVQSLAMPTTRLGGHLPGQSSQVARAMVGLHRSTGWGWDDDPKNCWGWPWFLIIQFIDSKKQNVGKALSG